MEIPQSGEIVEIEYRGERILGVVSSVIPHEGEKEAFWIWLQVDQEIPKGETVCWLLKEGGIPNYMVHEVSKRNGQSLIRLGAYQGAKPE
jgi:hypothetical protein